MVLSTARYGLASLLYIVLIAYSSTVIGPSGLNFVPLDPGEALHRILSIPYVQNGSDQRSDWMGNLMLLVPLGFLLAGFFARGGRLTPARGFAAFLICLAFVLVVKCAQLFFPPRTVTLNYVLAQSLGAVVGLVLYEGLREAFDKIDPDFGRLENLRLVLRLYTGVLLLFMLTPLDFALNEEDLVGQLAKLRPSFTALSGDGRPFVVQMAVLLGGIVALVPTGALLTLEGTSRVHVGRSVGMAAFLGFCGMMVVYGLTVVVMSGTPSLPAVFFRTFGIALGAWGMYALTRRDPDDLSDTLARVVPWIVPAYVLGILAVNGLLSLDRTVVPDDVPRWGERNLMPLYND